MNIFRSLLNTKAPFLHIRKTGIQL